MTTAGRNLRIALASLVLALAPLTFSPAGGLEENEACSQTGTCCSESGSTCVIGTAMRTNAYYKSEGSCAIKTGFIDEEELSKASGS